VLDDYLICGNADGTIRFYDYYFKVVAWFEDLKLNMIKSISFSNTEARLATTDFQDEVDKAFKCPDFLVADDSAMVCMLQSTIFEEIEPAKKKGYTIFNGLKSSITAIAVHPDPKKPILAIAGSTGFILLWDYLRKEFVFHNYEYF